MVMARTASIPGHDFIWKTAADAGFAPMWWRRPLMCRFCSPWFPAVLESLPSAMIWPVSAKARWLLSPAGGSLCQRPPDVERGQPESRPAPPAGRIPVHLLNTAQTQRRRSVGIGGAAYSGLHFLRRVTGPLSPSGHTPSEPEYTGRCSVADRRRPPRHPLRAASSMPSKSSTWLPRSVRQSA